MGRKLSRAAMKPKCDECGLRANSLIQHASGMFVCKKCWDEHDYGEFFWPKGHGGALDGQ